MTIQVKLVNCANWDEDVRVMTSHGQEYKLRRGDVTPPMGVPHGEGKELRLSVHPDRKGEPGYLGEVDVTTHYRERTKPPKTVGQLIVQLRDLLYRHEAGELPTVELRHGNELHVFNEDGTMVGEPIVLEEGPKR